MLKWLLCAIGFVVLPASPLLGQPAHIIDQDEFEEAIALYGYTPEFQAQCWQAAEEARLLAESWFEKQVR